MHTCTACGWSRLRETPRTPSTGGSYEICPSCGFQPGVTDDDEGITPALHRAAWVKKGMPWSSVAAPAPKNWNPAQQLKRVAT
jgi:hypothetical protein